MLKAISEWDWISERTFAMRTANNTAGRYENVEDDDNDANRVVVQDPLV